MQDEESNDSSGTIVDPPGPLAPLKVWQRHLQRLQSIPEPDAAVKAGIRLAKRMLEISEVHRR